MGEGGGEAIIPAHQTKLRCSRVMAERIRALGSSFGVSDRQSVGSSPSHDTYVLKQVT